MAIGSGIGKMLQTAVRTVSGTINQGMGSGSGPLGRAFKNIQNFYGSPETGVVRNALPPSYEPPQNSLVLKALRDQNARGGK